MKRIEAEGSGTFFVLPPHHRLFCVFDDAATGYDVAAELQRAGDENDVWTFSGEKGIASLEPGAGHHGAVVSVVRLLQRVMTSDCEYCDGLASALRDGAMVLGVRVGRNRVDELSEQLAQRGGHNFAYGAHWDFVPVGVGGPTVASFPSRPRAEPSSGAVEDAAGSR